MCSLNFSSYILTGIEKEAHAVPLFCVGLTWLLDRSLHGEPLIRHVTDLWELMVFSPSRRLFDCRIGVLLRRAAIVAADILGVLKTKSLKDVIVFHANFLLKLLFLRFYAYLHTLYNIFIIFANFRFRK